MTQSDGPGKAPEGGGSHGPAGDDGLDSRRRDLDAKLATHRVAKAKQAAAEKSRGPTGYGQALRLSSEFIAAIIVGAVLGWIIDRAAGTSPWGLILFLLLGFCAGILNVLRSAGVVADAGIRVPGPDDKVER